MRPIIKMILVLFGAAAFSSGACFFAGGVKEGTKTDLPDAVLKSFQKSFPGININGHDIEVVDGRTEYEIETKVNQVEMDYIYLANGTLLQTEEVIPDWSLPQVVVASVRAAHPGCDVKEAEEIVHGSAIEYEVEIEVTGKEIELLVSSDGQLLVSDHIDDETKDEADEDGD